jgi:hypothetical protein
MTSDETHHIFEKFCHEWNKGKLPDMYYTGIPPDIRDSCIKTQHK